MPKGDAWNTSNESNLLALLSAIAETLVTIDHQANSLILESIPSQANELIERWAKTLNISFKNQSTEDLKKLILQGLNSTGGCSYEMLIRIAQSFGLEINIEEFTPATTEKDILQRTYSVEWNHVLLIRITNIEKANTTPLKIGMHAGNYLNHWGIQLFEEMIRSIMPAHTHVIFAYGHKNQQKNASHQEYQYFIGDSVGAPLKRNLEQKNNNFTSEVSFIGSFVSNPLTNS